MRLLKVMLAMVAGSAVALGGASASALHQTPPAKKSPAAPAKSTPAPAKQNPVPAKKVQAPAKQAAAPAPNAPPAKTAAPPGDAAAQISVSPEMSPGNRRDPFAALISSRRGPAQAPEITCRAPGKGSIVIDTMKLDGLVRSGEGMIAAVHTPQGRAYFLREGDKLCDGRVERITMEGMTLRQSSRDAFGRGVDRPVNKRLFPSAGE